MPPQTRLQAISTFEKIVGKRLSKIPTAQWSGPITEALRALRSGSPATESDLIVNCRYEVDDDGDIVPNEVREVTESECRMWGGTPVPPR
jgi:hypothetical protein